MKKIARILLRVSSNQQLEADGDLTIQRQIVQEYVLKNENWILDDKEYFEGSNSGYKNSVADRYVLQEALQDARNREYDILVVYKDDRIGRRMWEIGAYVMQLKNNNVDIYTVKDGKISPESDDIMGQMVLALRYGNAQKSSSDTGIRVKDTAQKLVQKGKFMGGKAPYGYELVYSGELSKHGRALKKLQIVEEKADVVRYIYDLSLEHEYGSYKIAKTLNSNSYYLSQAPNDVWKSGTITSILTNPVYCGHIAYKRREKINGSYLRLDDSEWIKSEIRDESISIVEESVWSIVQKKRKERKENITSFEDKNANVIKKNDGILPLIDVAYCGYCKGKLTNGTKYNYWTIKGTNEKRASKLGAYKCKNAWEGLIHEEGSKVFFSSATYEKIVFNEISKYLEEIMKDVDSSLDNNEYEERSKKSIKAKLKKLEQHIEKSNKSIAAMEDCIPLAVIGEYALTVEQLSTAISNQKEKLAQANEEYIKVKNELEGESDRIDYLNNLKSNIPKWNETFLNKDNAQKRVIVNQLVERIEFKRDNIEIEYKFKLNNI